MTVDREKLLQAHPIQPFLEARGIDLRKSGAELKCRCPFHADKDPSMSVNTDKNLWHCFVCGIGGTIIDFALRQDGTSVNEIINQLAEKAHMLPTDDKPRTVAKYGYKDKLGREVMTVRRVEQMGKKRFVQSHKAKDGTTVNNINGVERVLFRLERWHAKQEVALLEGEKCCAAMESIGIDATCNPGGSNGWLDGYATYLADKHVDIWPDNDEAGDKWAEAVLASLEGKVASLRVLRVPPIYNDIADLVIAQGKDEATETVFNIMGGTDRIERGVVMPLLSAAECWEMYRKSMTDKSNKALDLSLWLPSLAGHVRALMPGDMVLVLAETGVGKTTILGNIAQSQKHMKSIFFEFELSPEPMCERFIAMTSNTHKTHDVERSTRAGQVFDVSAWDHIYICPESGIDAARIEEIVERSELKMGERPGLVLVDYIGLMNGKSNKRYEKVADAAEGLKQVARRTNTIVVVASQLSRNPERKEVTLNDGKDSGSLENSAQLVIGAWKTAPSRITLRVLKQTKKAGEYDVECTFDGDRQAIKEITGSSGMPTPEEEERWGS